MREKYKTRVLISFDGSCPMQCKHCYTYELNKPNRNRNIQQLVDSIQDKTFDVIYVSQSYENFYDENKGIEFCLELYNRYQKDMFVITRRFLSDATIEKLSRLNQKMKQNGHNLFFAVSLCAGKSYEISENKAICPAPTERLSNLERLNQCNIPTILLLRPVFPNGIVSTQEYIDIIKESHNYVDAVVSSGLIVTNNILNKLALKPEAIKYLENGDSEYLDNLDRDKTKYVDTETELKEIQAFCQSLPLPFFRHSMPALNHLVDNG